MLGKTRSHFNSESLLPIKIDFAGVFFCVYTNCVSPSRTSCPNHVSFTIVTISNMMSTGWAVVAAPNVYPLSETGLGGGCWPCSFLFLSHMTISASGMWTRIGTLSNSSSLSYNLFLRKRKNSPCSIFYVVIPGEISLSSQTIHTSST